MLRYVVQLPNTLRFGCPHPLRLLHGRTIVQNVGKYVRSVHTVALRDTVSEHTALRMSARTSLAILSRNSTECGPVRAFSAHRPLPRVCTHDVRDKSVHGQTHIDNTQMCLGTPRGHIVTNAYAHRVCE